MGQQPQGYPQPGYPQQGYPQGYPGYQQPQFPGSSGPRKPKTGLIVLIVVLVVVVVGGGTTALILLNKGKPSTTNTAGPSAPATSSGGGPDSTAVGRYQKPPACGQLNGGPFTFQPTGPVLTQGKVVGGDCSGIGHPGGDSDDGLGALIEVFNGPGGVAAAAASASGNGGQKVDGPGFENAPYVSYNGGDCVFSYSRSNESVRFQFMGLPGVSDAASCASTGMTYAQQYYKLVG